MRLAIRLGGLLLSSSLLLLILGGDVIVADEYKTTPRGTVLPPVSSITTTSTTATHYYHDDATNNNKMELCFLIPIPERTNDLNPQPASTTGTRICGSLLFDNNPSHHDERVKMSSQAHSMLDQLIDQYYNTTSNPQQRTTATTTTATTTTATTTTATTTTATNENTASIVSDKWLEENRIVLPPLVRIEEEENMISNTSSASRHSYLRGGIVALENDDYEYKHPIQQEQELPRVRRQQRRYLFEQFDDQYEDDDGPIEQDDDYEEGFFMRRERQVRSALQYLWCFAMILMCVSIAALASGLLMGMYSLEPIQLLIKMRVGTPKEKRQSEKLLPLVEQSHRLLVTLMLVTTFANESLPMYLEKLLPEHAAVIISVVLVLLFGEILPSAIFTGHNQIAIAAKFAPLVRGLMWLLYPVAGPIARGLDKMLGHDDTHSNGVADAFNRGEISALVRVIYEEQKRSKHEKATTMLVAAAQTLNSPTNAGPHQSSHFLDIDEVTMVEGALQMKTKTANDVYRLMDHVYAVNENAILDEETIAELHSCGHSRIPVYEDGPSGHDGAISLDDEDGIKKRRIKGILMTRNLIVVDWSMKRRVKSLPLLKPHCVSPSMSLIDLTNEFQKHGSSVGMAGHLAIVCRNPQLANNALAHGDAIPVEAGVLGIVTLEDVIEELLQEDIVDESDKVEVKTLRLARKVIRKWRAFVQKKKAEREAAEDDDESEMTLPFGGCQDGSDSSNLPYGARALVHSVRSCLGTQHSLNTIQEEYSMSHRTSSRLSQQHQQQDGDSPNSESSYRLWLT